MYICICHAVTDHSIRAEVRSGAESFSELSFRTGCGSQCGSCVPEVRKVMKEALVECERSEVPSSLNIVSAACGG
jgi:bacterioferritin-associated ferredoxin